MELVIRMKTVARFLIFTASVVVWLVILAILQHSLRLEAFGLEEELPLLGAVALGLLQTWILVVVLRT